jgi:hypothetical protein
VSGEFQMRVTHRWNLNETAGRYARTGLVEEIVDLKLGLKRPDGKKEPVGHYQLPTDELADKGFVRRRFVDGQRVFDLQIYCGSDGIYSLRLQKKKTTLLTRYSV